MRLTTTSTQQRARYTFAAALALGFGCADAQASFASSVSLSFEGISQYDAASFGRNFIPPDTMGAVGSSQYLEVANGAYAVFDKTTGSHQSLVSDTNLSNQGDRCDRSRLEKKAAGKGLRDRADVDLSFFN